MCWWGGKLSFSLESASRSAPILVAGLCRQPSGCVRCLWFCCPAKEAQNRKHERKWNTCLVYIFSQRRNGPGWGSWGLISKTEHWFNFPSNIQSCKKALLMGCREPFLLYFLLYCANEMHCCSRRRWNFHWCQMKTDSFSLENMLNVHFSLPLVFFLHMKYVFSALNGLQVDQTRGFRTQSSRASIRPGFRFHHLPWWKQCSGWTENPADLRTLGTGFWQPWINPLKPSTEHSSV